MSLADQPNQEAALAQVGAALSLPVPAPEEEFKASILALAPSAAYPSAACLNWLAIPRRAYWLEQPRETRPPTPFCGSIFAREEEDEKLVHARYFLPHPAIPDPVEIPLPAQFIPIPELYAALNERFVLVRPAGDAT